MIELPVSSETVALRRQDAAYRMRAGWSRLDEGERVLVLEALPPRSDTVVVSVVQVMPARSLRADEAGAPRRSRIRVLAQPTDEDPAEWWLIHADVLRRAGLRARAMDRDGGIVPRRLQVPTHGGAIGARDVREAIGEIAPPDDSSDPVDRGARDALAELAARVLPPDASA